MIMDAQDIIELIEYFRNLQNNEMKFEIEELRGYIDIRFEELYDKLTEYIDFNREIQITHYKRSRDIEHLCSLVNNPLNTHRVFGPTIFEANF